MAGRLHSDDRSTSSSPDSSLHPPRHSAPYVLDGSQFSLAAAITAGSEAQWQYVVDSPLCVGFDGTYDGGGFITDHRGVSYPIVVPRVETADGQVFTADLGSGRRWRAECGHARRNGSRMGRGR